MYSYSESSLQLKDLPLQLASGPHSSLPHGTCGGALCSQGTFPADLSLQNRDCFPAFSTRSVVERKDPSCGDHASGFKVPPSRPVACGDAVDP
jgi:hypothetical protein